MAAFVGLVGVVVPAVGLVGAGAAGADAPATGFYLDLGGSESVGVQPTAAVARGQRTSYGYSNDLVSYEAARGVSLQLTELGCPGETTTAMINGGDHCYPSPSSQFSEALAFLRSHQGESGIVTIDLGFNDVHHCFHRGVVDETCVENQIDAVRQQLPTIIAGLKNVAGPGVTFVGLGHYDPFLADALKGPAGQQFAHETAAAIGSLNEVLRTVYVNADVAMANVGATFESHNVERVNMVGEGMVPVNVANTCAFTWMCAPPPFGPNLHPNDAGYAMIASAIEGVLKSPW
ncbi:MAG TPA: SGNH/GDSL hydrolase family protein [Acidimicrobiales bacterium]|nr:SGNH/GDSL hydrolase family protein [Acidimicrobiales bacterium]